MEGVCATKKESFVKEVMNLPVSPVIATVVLIGVPATVMAREHVEYKDICNHATLAAIDCMPIVKIARKKKFVCERYFAPDTMGMLFHDSICQEKAISFMAGKMKRY